MTEIDENSKCCYCGEYFTGTQIEQQQFKEVSDPWTERVRHLKTHNCITALARHIAALDEWGKALK